MAAENEAGGTVKPKPKPKYRRFSNEKPWQREEPPAWIRLTHNVSSGAFTLGCFRCLRQWPLSEAKSAFQHELLKSCTSPVPQ